jgi:glycine/D-amino acid oxidase-like deaminating enzyme
MMSACDEDTVTADEAYHSAPSIEAQLLDKLTRFCPELATLPIAHHWAGARTFAPNDQIFLKWDTHAPQFYWIAGLGGHGVTAAAGVGQRAAGQLCLRAR